MPTLTLLFGEQENRDWNQEDIDWNSIDRNLVSEHIVVTQAEINGKRLGSLHLRNTYDINISRVLRSGVQILATPDLILQLGDRLTVVGEKRPSSAWPAYWATLSPRCANPTWLPFSSASYWD